MTVGLSTTVIFGDLGVYFLGNVRDKASNISCRYAAFVGQKLIVKCDLEQLLYVKIRFWPARLSRAYLCVR